MSLIICTTWNSQDNIYKSKTPKKEKPFFHKEQSTIRKRLLYCDKVGFYIFNQDWYQNYSLFLSEQTAFVWFLILHFAPARKEARGETTNWRCAFKEFQQTANMHSLKPDLSGVLVYCYNNWSSEFGSKLALVRLTLRIKLPTYEKRQTVVAFEYLNLVIKGSRLHDNKQSKRQDFFVNLRNFIFFPWW